MSKIIIDVDTGFDDAIAIILALASEDLDVVGITTVNGNRPVAETTENTLRVIDALGIDCPVYKGLDQPLVACLNEGRKPGFPYTEPIELHGDILDLPETDRKPEKMNAVSWLIDYLENTDEPVTLVGLAPLTNLGVLFRIAPHVVKNIKEIVLMGGAYQSGNVTPVAEFNFWADPEAAQIVIKQPVPVKLITINATSETKLTFSECLQLGENKTVAANLVAKILLSVLGENKTIEIYDALAICSILSEKVVEYTAMTANIDISGGIADGQLVAVKADDTDSNLSVALHADKYEFLKIVNRIIE